MTQDGSELDARIAALRRFNRFYTREIGVLRKGFLGSKYSLAEMRVLYEIAHRERPTPSEVARVLDLDAGYLSRILSKFETSGLIAKRVSERDARQVHLTLTARGRKTFAPLEQRSNEEVGAMLAKLTEADQARLVAATHTIEHLLGPSRTDKLPPYVLRPHRPGDLGWIVSRHGSVYAEEFGWDLSFEALVAEIIAEFVKTFDAKREQSWIADVDGEPVGSLLLVRQSDDVAKLRLLLVERKARGLGIGTRLVEEAIRFARLAGYRKITLWTQSILGQARNIYAKAGFRLASQAPHHSFGQDLIGENWELAL